MGNTFSYSFNGNENKENSNTGKISNEMENAMKTTSLIDYVDMVATNYILKQNMVDMIRFTDKEHYDNMILLTSYIMKKQLSSLDIGILKNRVMEGNQNSINNENNNTYITSTNDLKEITLHNEKKKQKALLIISKFYIKVMTLFSAVVATIDPQYVYEDEEGNKKYFNLRDFNSYKQLDKETRELRVSRLDNPIGLVKKRLTILKNKMQEKSSDDIESDHVVMNPGEIFCEAPKEDGDGDGENTNNSVPKTSLHREIGIKELDALYFDMYDYETNTWNRKSEAMDRKYQEDLVKFYQIFTGKKNKPEHIKTFADIESLQLHEVKRCVNRDYYQDLLVSKKDSLFRKYMEKIYMIQNITKSYKKKLLHILKQVIIPSAGNSDTLFTINPALHMDSLLEHQDEIKRCINQIYMNCERLFIEALIIYEKLYERQHGVLVESQVNQLENDTVNNEMKTNMSTSNSVKQNNNVMLDANALSSSTPEETPINGLTPTPDSAMSPDFETPTPPQNSDIIKSPSEIENRSDVTLMNTNASETSPENKSSMEEIPSSSNTSSNGEIGELPSTPLPNSYNNAVPPPEPISNNTLPEGTSPLSSPPLTASPEETPQSVQSIPSESIGNQEKIANGETNSSLNMQKIPNAGVPPPTMNNGPGEQGTNINSPQVQSYESNSATAPTPNMNKIPNSLESSVENKQTNTIVKGPENAPVNVPGIQPPVTGPENAPVNAPGIQQPVTGPENAPGIQTENQSDKPPVKVSETLPGQPADSALSGGSLFEHVQEGIRKYLNGGL